MFSRIMKPKNKKSSKSAAEGSDGDAMDIRATANNEAANASRSVDNGLRGSVLSSSITPGSSPGAAALPAVYTNGAVMNAPLPTEPLPAFRDVPSSERQALFVKKLRLCCIMYDFTDPTKNVKEKEIKQQTLSDLVDYVAAGSAKFTEAVTQECFRMIHMNLFRALPTTSHECGIIEGFDADEEEPSMDPAWSHLQHVYDLLMFYVNSGETDPKVAKTFINQSFVLSLLDLFDSEDPRERECLKTILHRIYGKFMVHRPFIRKSINNIFYRYIFETERFSGIAELLEILGSIINGFALPLKEEHKLFLVRALIPLHKPKSVATYHQQLSYCITQFVEKDFQLADIIIIGLIKCWPVTNSQKEILFIGELEEVLDATQPAEFRRCMIPLFRQISRCLKSMHFQVAERALFLWNNEHIVNLIAQNREVILPLIFDALEANTTSHWNLTVNGLTSNVKKMFLDLDPELFQACKQQYEANAEKVKTVEEMRERTWRQLETLAAPEEGDHVCTVNSMQV